MSAHLKALTRRTSPEIVPIFPLSGTVMLPATDLPLNIFEPRYLNMIDDALKGDRVIGMIQASDSLSGGVARVGGLGRITQFSETDDGRYIIVLKGLKRFNYLRDLEPTEEGGGAPYRKACISYDGFDDDHMAHDTRAVSEALSETGMSDRASLTLAMKAFAKSLGVQVDWDGLKEVPLPNLVNQAAMISPFKSDDKQSLLEAPDTDERRRLLIGLMHLYSNPDGGQPNSPRN
jgi:Lon protease-like protein